MSRVKLKVTLTYFVTSVLSHVTHRYRQSHESPNVNHDRFLTLTKWLCCLNLTSCENGSLFACYTLCVTSIP